MWCTPERKLTIISIRKSVSETMLKNMILRSMVPSDTNAMHTGRTIKLMISRISISRSQ